MKVTVLIDFWEHHWELLKQDALTFVRENKSYAFVINNDASFTNVTKCPGCAAHVYHQHINPFQVQAPVGENGFIALSTTWWDTLGNFPRNESEYIRMKMWTRDYVGLIIVHCHLLQHEGTRLRILCVCALMCCLVHR